MVRTCSKYFSLFSGHLIWIQILVLWRSFEVCHHKSTGYICWPKLICGRNKNLVDHLKGESVTKNINSMGSLDAVNNFTVCVGFTSSEWTLSLCNFTIASDTLISSRVFDIFPFLMSLFASIPRKTLCLLWQRLSMNWYSLVSKFSWMSGSWLWFFFWKYLTFWFQTEDILSVFFTWSVCWDKDCKFLFFFFLNSYPQLSP